MSVDVTEELESLRKKRSALVGEIGIAEDAQRKLKELHARLAKLDRVLAALEPDRPRAKKGAADALIRKLVGANPTLADDAILALAQEQKDAPSRSALARALRGVRAEVIRDAGVPN